MRARRIWLTFGAALAMTFGVASSAVAVIHPPDPPSGFVYPITNPNPFFPLVPGTTFYYQGESEGVATSNITEVTCTTLPIEGVTTTVVHDQAFDELDRLVEDTLDYYAQDGHGNVWYFGEDTAEKDPVTGTVISTEGTWRAGVNEADAGFIMLAGPQVGDRYYQEFARDVAEDQAKTISLDGSATIPYGGSYEDLVVSKETTRLDPGVVENKFYAEGTGFIYGVMVKGGEEFTQLVNVTTTSCP